MPANVIQANYDDLDKAASSFSEYSDSVENLQRTITGHMDRLRSNGWIGKGADSFYREMESELLPGLNRLVKALGDASSATNRIAAAFRQAEEEACRLFEGGGGAGTGGAGGGIGGGAGGSTGGIGGGSGSAGGKSFFDQVSDFFGSDSGIRKALQRGAVELAGRFGSDVLPDFLNKLGKEFAEKVGGQALSKVLGTVGGGFLGGVVDIGFAYLGGQPMSGEFVATQLISGGIQGAISLHPVGAAVMLGDLVIQTGGNVGAELGLMYADAMKSISPTTAPKLEASLNGLKGGLDKISIDNRIDGAVGTGVAGYQLFESYVPGTGMIGGIGGAAVGLVREGWTMTTGLAETSYYLMESSFNFGQTIGEAIVTQGPGIIDSVGSAASKAWNFLF